MRKFFGPVGYATTVEKQPGVWDDVIVERNYYGDVIKYVRQLTPGEDLIPDVTVNSSISILADAYATEHFHSIRYVSWAGAFWIVKSIDPESPRLVLHLGGVYNGPKAGASSTP